MFMNMDFQSAMETFAEAWVAANTKSEGAEALQSHALALTRSCKTTSPVGGGTDLTMSDRPPSHSASRSMGPQHTPGQQGSESDHMLTPKKEGLDFSKNSSSKSLPVHCVVESVSTLEALEAGPAPVTSRRSTIEADSYVIIPSVTAFKDLVPSALVRLGYPQDCCPIAKGSVVIKNWKPLALDLVCTSPLTTVGEVLGELTALATLRIQLLRPRAPLSQDMKDKLLRLLLLHGHTLLISTGCPLDEVTLAQLCRGSSVPHGPHSYHEPSDEVRRKFDLWWASQIQPRPPPFSPRPPPSPLTKMDRPPSLGTLPEHVHPALQTVQSQYPTQKTRMRTSFDPELELPKLQRWFADNQHPSRQQIQQYVRELNNLESRRGRKPLDVNNVVYWFKNARAAQKRAELRNIGPGGLSCHMSLNGYNSSSHSPTNGSMLLPHDIYMSDRLSEHHSMKSPLSISPGRGHPMSMVSEDNISNGGSDVDDDDMMDDQRDDERPESPEAPLSLITTKKETEPEAVKRTSPKPPDIPKIDEIKQEPNTDDSTKPQDLSPNNFPVNDNNNHVNNNNNKGNDQENNISDEEDEELDHDVTDDDLKSNRRSSEESLQTMNPSRVADMNRQRMRSFRSPSPSDLMSGGQLVPKCPPGSQLDRFSAAGFPIVPNSMFSHSFMYMSHYIPGLSHSGLPTSPPGSSAMNLSAIALSNAADERRKRNRTFIDPVTEVPRLEQWFSLNTHPSHNLIIKYTEELNRMPYRQKFPRLESKNVQFWFKNRRAKCKRLKMSLYETGPPGSLSQYHINE